MNESIQTEDSVEIIGQFDFDPAEEHVFFSFPNFEVYEGNVKETFGVAWIVAALSTNFFGLIALLLTANYTLLHVETVVRIFRYVWKFLKPDLIVK